MQHTKVCEEPRCTVTGCVCVRGRHVSPRHVSMPPLLLLARAEAGLGRASWHK